MKQHPHFHTIKNSVPFIMYPDVCRSATIDAILHGIPFCLLPCERNFALSQLKGVYAHSIKQKST